MKNFVIALVGFAVGALLVAAAWAKQESPTYILAQLNIEDRVTYGKYEAEFGPILLRHEGEVVAFSESPEVLEGDWNYGRTVALRFKSKDAASAWYNDPDYQRIAKHRWASSNGNVVLIGGR